LRFCSTNLIGFKATVGYIGSVGLPLPTLAAVLALVVEIIGSLALLEGLGTRIAAIVLAVFTLVATLYFHNYWEPQLIKRLCNNSCSSRTLQL